MPSALSQSARHAVSRGKNRGDRITLVAILRPILAGVLVLCVSGVACAGMPSPQLILTELGKRRLEEISFFLVGFLLLAAGVRWVWNGLGKEIPALPRLSYRGTLGLLLLWGLALTVVLALVSGARELMTPAAWEPNGVTHKLVQAANAPLAEDEELALRRRRLAALKAALWDYAAQHDGRFPDELAPLAEDIRIADEASGLTYSLTPGLALSSPSSVLAREPDLFPRRLLLLTDGLIAEESRPGSDVP